MKKIQDKQDEDIKECTFSPRLKTNPEYKHVKSRISFNNPSTLTASNRNFQKE